LDQHPQEIFHKAMLTATEELISKLFLHLKQNSNPDEGILRIFLILFLNPLMYDENHRIDLGKNVATLCNRIRSKSKSILVQWLSMLDFELFSRMVSMFKELLIGLGMKVNESFIGTVKILSLLSHSNELCGTPIVPLTSFYVPELTSALNIKDEYRKWRRSLESGTVTDFALINYPFLFDPVSKTRIMHIDAWVKMSLKYEDAYVNQTLVFQAQKFIDDPDKMETLELELQNSTNPYFLLNIRRSNLVEDTMDQLSNKILDIRKPLKVKFVGGGEEGMDQGGVQKEFFQVLISDIIDPNFGMFIYDPETRFTWFNPATLEPSSQFELVGMIVGLALYNGVMLRILFPPMLYKKLLNEDVSLDDVKIAFPSLGNGLQQLLDWKDGDVADIFMRTFEISYERFGQVEHIPLKPNGHELFVTNENRKEYVSLYIRHLANTSVESSFRYFQQGFYKVCGGKVLSLCRPLELELMICGIHTSELDFYKLEEGVAYDDGFSRNHQVIQWFWQIVHEMDLDHKRNLLEFVTASDRVPLKGLESLLFVIQKNGPDTNRLPSALTCFGRLLLPEYSSYSKLKERLITAIENAKGFGLV
jgi:ubiquitin-protein ligase E3 A